VFQLVEKLRLHAAPLASAEAAEARHARKVRRIAGALRAQSGEKPVSLRKRAVPHQVPKRKDLRRADAKVDTRDLTEILAIDVAARVCVAEAGVTFEKLLQATLAHGLVPAVVPELKTITVGGAVAGCSLESMSFERGGFHDSCVEYEVITGMGDVLRCTPDGQHALTFQMMHGTFGTLGVLSKLTFRLVPAKPFVQVAYERHETLESYVAAIRRHAAARDLDFMDGIVHSPRLYVLAAGRFVDTAPYTNRYDWMKVYYQSTRTRFADYLTTPNYLFRYDRGVTNVRPKSWPMRLLFGKLLSSNEWLWLASKAPWLLPKERPTVTLDVFIPVHRVPEFFAWYEREIGHYPLWCVPYRCPRDYEWLDASFWSRLGEERFFLDFAIYGMEQPKGVNVYRKLELELQELGGMKTLIAHNYYSADEFWATWSRPNYDAVKALTDPKNLFRDLYDKTCRAAMGRR
jgi:FAD/FMN-containing dehydrogenase